MKTESERAYDQGAADYENGQFGDRPNYMGDHMQDYWRGWQDAAGYASEASLRYAESGAAYEDYLDAKSRDGWSEREEAYERFLEGLAYEFDNTTDAEREAQMFVHDPFMARVFAYGEEAKREADKAEIARNRYSYLNDAPF